MAAMGHGDELAVVDANFPAYSVARGTTNARVVPMARRVNARGGECHAVVAASRRIRR